MDGLISKGIGGFATRTEFIVDAIQERYFELTFGSPEGEPGYPSTSEAPRVESERPTDTDDIAISSVSTIVVATAKHGYSSDAPSLFSLPESRPLFGLHNRDFPTLWSLSRLAEVAFEAPVPVEAFYELVIRNAWEFGRVLMLNEKITGIKSTALFPTNPDKRKSAELGFRAYAVGDFRINSLGSFESSGPLFEWQVVKVTGTSKEPMIEVSKAGWRLLDAIDGLSVDEPHAMNASASFLSHLKDYAQGDFSGFRLIIETVGVDGCTRQEVLARTAENWPSWTDNEVSTNSGGYIARAREWGLVQPKQTKGRYQLTEFGEHYLTTSIGRDS